MTEGIGHLSQAALCIINVGGDVRDIRAWAVSLFYKTQVVVTIGPATCRRM